jgi:MYXO-CTERM domain-containing protein
MKNGSANFFSRAPKMQSRTSIAAIATIFLFAVMLSSPIASATPIELLNWAPVPDSVAPPFAEINYTGANLQTDVGALSNGDGNLPVTNQTPGGLQVDTIVTAPVPFSFPSSVFTGGTGYYDVSLTFTGLAPVGAATQTLLPGPMLLDAQVLGTGTFTLTATTAIAGAPVVLLTGTVANAVITGIDGGSAGAVIDAHGINYTGGVIFGAFDPTWLHNGNDLSISMTSVIPGFAINGASGQMNPFHADATGQFDINAPPGTPEPASLVLALMGLAGLAVCRCRRRSF